MFFFVSLRRISFHKHHEIDGHIRHFTVEVKSSTYKTHVSMDEFCKKFSSRIANDRNLVYTKDYFKEGAIKYLPAYLAYFL